MLQQFVYSFCYWSYFYLIYMLILIFLAPFYLVFNKDLFVFETKFYGPEKITLTYINSKLFFIKNITLPLEIFGMNVSVVGPSLRDQPYDFECPENILPGLVSLFDVSLLSKLPEAELEKVEYTYLNDRRIFKRTRLFLLFVFCFVFYRNKNSVKSRVELFGISMLNKTTSEVIKDVESSIRRTLFFLNAESFNRMKKDHDLNRIIHQNSYNIIDGSGVNLACKLTRQNIQENLNGTDLFPHLLRSAAQREKKVYFLGAKRETLVKMQSKLKQIFPKLEIVGLRDGYFNLEKESRCIVEDINSSGADFVFVGMGTPIQEKWISQYRDELRANIVLGVGGLFDFYSGEKRRAPHWLRLIGMEWCYRLYLEPVRLFKRYVIGNPLFLLNVLIRRNKEIKSG